MIPIHIAETGWHAHALTPEQARRLIASGIAKAEPAPHRSDLWNLAARGKVGVATIGDLEVWIAPKLSIDRLLFLVGFTCDPRGWRDEPVGMQVRDGLVPSVGHALWRQAERALRQGLLMGYVEVDETAQVLRGRMREADQLRRWHGRPVPIESRHDDFTADIAENRVLLAAVTRMATVPRLDTETRTRLGNLRKRLADVASPVRGTSLPAWRPTRLNTRYHNALRLAEVVWRATSPEHAPGSLRANGFLFDLPKIFEEFVTVALGEALTGRHSGIARPQFETHLDEGADLRMRPDLVWEHRGKPVAVVDAKYKRERPEGYPNADIYQVLAYCTALGLRRGHLVYAKGNAEPRRHVVRHAGTEIFCHAVDLSLPPENLLARMDELADELADVAHAA